MTDLSSLEKRSKEVLEASAGRLDGRTRSRLTQARHAALDQLQRPARHWWRSYVPAGAAAAAVLAVVMWTGSPQVEMLGESHASSPVDDIELLADADAPDFLDDDDDLEFYEWAAGEVES